MCLQVFAMRQRFEVVWELCFVMLALKLARQMQMASKVKRFFALSCKDSRREFGRGCVNVSYINV